MVVIRFPVNIFVRLRFSALLSACVQHDIDRMDKRESAGFIERFFIIFFKSKLLKISFQASAGDLIVVVKPRNSLFVDVC